MIPFVKAHACGNDFLIVDEKFANANHVELTQRFCDRHSGIGADGVEWVSGERTNWNARLLNADGSEAEISGNGTRCVAAWLAAARALRDVNITTGAGVRRCRVISGAGTHFEIETEMGTPAFERCTVNGIAGVKVQVGNPHFVTVVDHIPEDWEGIGGEISLDDEFPDQCNVEFVRITGADSIEFRIWERGVGPTQSSGSGSCAVAVAAIHLLGMPRSLRVSAPGGDQRVRWDGQVFLTGPAELIARGEAWL